MYEELERFHEEADRDLERRVTAFLADRNLPALRRLGVRSHRGVVTLRGNVKSFYEKQLGGQSARRVAGVIDVIDAIQVATDASLFSVGPTTDRNRRTAIEPPVVVNFDSHRVESTQAYSAGGFDPISQAKG
jgi:osmotically-inducible protein OsmY